MERIVVVSTDNSPGYYFYSPYIKKAWNHLGWKVCVMITHDTDEKLIAGDYVIRMPDFPGVHTATQSQAGRLYAANHLPKDAYLMVSDMDMIPLSNYWNPSANLITIYGHDLTDYTEYPMCYIGMLASKWRDVMALTGNTLSDFLRDVGDWLVRYSDDWTKMWGYDQALITKKLEPLKSTIQFIDRGRDISWPYANGRIDRATGFRIIDQPWVDAHCYNSNSIDLNHIIEFKELFQTVYGK